MAKGYQKYQQIDVSTADPLRIVILLYEGAIKNLNQAVRLLGEDRSAASVRLNKTLDIINYLRSVLDHHQGGEIAGNLDRLYAHMRDRLTMANIKADKEPIQEVTALLQTLLDGWRGISSNQTEAGLETVSSAITQEIDPSLRSVSLMG